jgi:hypothetical protein
MLRSNDAWILNFCLFLFLSVLLVLPLSNALSIQTPSLISSLNNQNVSFSLEISGNVSDVVVSKNSSFGNLVFDGAKYHFWWVADFSSLEFVEILFTAQNNTSSVSSSSVIARAPSIVGLQDVFIETSTYDINFVTDTSSVCRYSLSDKSFSAMEYTFKSDAGKKVHEGKTPILNQGVHTIYIICRSSVGAESKANFVMDINLYPSAEIRLTPPSPLRAGIIGVEVVASEDLIMSPVLKYYFDDDASPKTITLTGSGNRWSGFMVVQDSDKRRIGTFLFEGVDMTNKVGTEITSGKIFIVDNHVPSRLSSFVAVMQSNSIRLDWKYLDEQFDEIKEYRIYRKVGQGGVDYVNYLASTDKNHFVDDDVVHGKAYYYKVSAVNHASKEGPLSNEVAITFMPSRDVDESVSVGLSPELRTELRGKISFVDSLILDVDLAESKIQRLSGFEESQLVRDLELLSGIVASRNKLRNIVSELSALESKSMSSLEFDRVVSGLISDANKIWGEVPLNLVVHDSLTYTEPAIGASSRSAFEKYLVSENFNLSDKATISLLNYLVDAQNSFIVESTLITAFIEYPNYEKDVYFVIKKISFPDFSGDVIILDNIASFNVNDLVFVERPVVIDNSVAKWSVGGSPSSKSVSYYSFTESSFDAFKSSGAFVVGQGKVQETRNLITGMVAKDVERSSHPLLVPLIIGLLSVVILSVYHFKSEDFSFGEIFSFKKMFSFRKLNLRKLFAKKDDSHKKLNLHEPPHLDKPASVVGDVESHIKLDKAHVSKGDSAHDSHDSHDESVHESTHEAHKEFADSVHEESDKSSLEIKVSNNIVDADNDFIDQTEQSNKDLAEPEVDVSFDDDVISESAKFSRKGTSALSKAKLSDDGSNDEVLNTLQDLKNIVEDIYYSKDDVKTSFDDDFKYISTVKRLRKNMLRPAPQGKEFFLLDGRMLKNLKELKDSLHDMSDDVFYHHVSREKNDFYLWVRDVFGYRALASQIKHVKSKKELLKKIKF